MAESRRFIAWLWILSIVIPAAILLAPSLRLPLFTCAIFLETAHAAAPIAMSWLHPGFRAVMFARPYKFIGLPALIIGITIMIGGATSLAWLPWRYPTGHLQTVSNPLVVLALFRGRLSTVQITPMMVAIWIYTVWNFYHFGMQNFGIVSLLRNRRTRFQRNCDMSWCVWMTAIGMMLFPAVPSFNHWIVAIGLSARVARRTWLFIGGLLLFGAVGWVWMRPSSHGPLILVIPIIIACRIGLGMWHFLQDRWAWKMSDPLVRETIGRDLLKQRTLLAQA